MTRTLHLDLDLAPYLGFEGAKNIHSSFSSTLRILRKVEVPDWGLVS